MTIKTSIQSFRKSTNLLKKFGKTFFFARLFLRKEAANHAAHLYALCRWLDDITDTPNCLEANDKHEKYPKPEQEKIFEILNTKLIQSQKTIAIDNEKILNPAALLALLEGLHSDISSKNKLDHRVCHTEEDLINYCFQVAGSVGLLMCNLFSVRDSNAWNHAAALGIGMQLTNIARDVYEDLELKRRYIPDNYLPSLEKDSLIRNVTDSDINSARLKIIKLADEYYQYGLQGIKYLPKNVRFGITTAALVYRHIGSKLQNRIDRQNTRRISTTIFEKFRIALTIFFNRHSFLRHTKLNKNKSTFRSSPYIDRLIQEFNQKQRSLLADTNTHEKHSLLSEYLSESKLQPLYGDFTVVDLKQKERTQPSKSTQSATEIPA